MARHILPGAPPNTASINVRLSKEAREENLSKDGMVEDCVTVAERAGLKVVSVHVDDGLTGAVRDRPGFVAWLDDARHLRADHLIAWHVDRMTREGVNVAGMILDTIEGKDPETGRVIRQPVRLLDTKGLDSSAGDNTAFRFQFVIAAEVARAERERMRDRNRAARRRALAAGRWSGGPAPFGFRVVDNPDGPGKVIEVDAAERDFVREAAERVLAGENISSVARWANGPGGLLPRRASRWTRRTMLQVLTGYPVQGRSMRIIEGRYTPVLDPNGHPVTFDAILTADESAAIRQRLAVRAPDARKGGRHPARLLSGLLSCHACGTHLQVARRTDGSVTYRCPEAYVSGTCKRPVSVSATALEDFMTSHFLSRWGTSAEVIRRAQVTGAAAVEQAEEEVARALEALAKAATAEAFADLQAAQAHRDEALDLPQEAVVMLVPSGRTISDAWETGDVHSRRDLLSINYAEIIVGPGKRGPRGIDPARLTIIAQPPHVLGTSDDDDFRRGAVATS